MDGMVPLEPGVPRIQGKSSSRAKDRLSRPLATKNYQLFQFPRLKLLAFTHVRYETSRQLLSFILD